MGKLARIALPQGQALPAFRDSLENPSVDLVTALVAETDGTSVTSVSLTPAKALRLTAVYACVRVIAESVASLPVEIYEDDDSGGQARTKGDPRGALLNRQPNPEQTAMELVESWLAHALLWGKGYLYAVRNNAGAVAELWPLRPDRTQQMRGPDGSLYYVTILDNGQVMPLPAENVIPLRSILGLSPVKVAREALAIGISAEEYAARFWANNARPGGVIEVDGAMNDDEYDVFRRRWRANHEGLKRGQLVGILTGGAHWRDVGIPPASAQFLESRNFGVRETARLFRVAPHMIGDLQGTVNRASIEQQSIEFVVYTLRPWVVRAEQALRAGLFSQKNDLAVNRRPEFHVDGLMRGDTASRYAAYALGINWGFLSRADVRALEHLPFVAGAGLEQYLMPANMLISGDDAPPAAGGEPEDIAQEEQNALLTPTALGLLEGMLRKRSPQTADKVLEVLRGSLERPELLEGDPDTGAALEQERGLRVAAEEEAAALRRAVESERRARAAAEAGTRRARGSR